jgi:hypothetical protein
MWQQSLGRHVTVASADVSLASQLVQLAPSRTATQDFNAALDVQHDESLQLQPLLWQQQSYSTSQQQQQKLQGQAVAPPAATFVEAAPTALNASGAAGIRGAATNRQQTPHTNWCSLCSSNGSSSGMPWAVMWPQPAVAGGCLQCSSARHRCAIQHCICRALHSMLTWHSRYTPIM